MDKLTYPDYCRFWDDGIFCTCGAVEYEKMKFLVALCEEAYLVIECYAPASPRGSLLLSKLKNARSVL